ncbi:hypothetical protein O181_024101 [Austropuccinia psidii MF-1]|uniref:Uncharacterized protein n=1 Tax=Austropuccinia psidii MF-1 TaxID=1389203 RepID=A0A9Q3CKQ7_9BASI|nr:hypothetical protein [Austropuccinia psidii MF-1]
MKDGNGKRTFELGMIVTMSCHPWDSNAKQPLLAQVAPNGWRTYSAHNEPPIPGPSPSSEPPENVPTCEPEPEVAQTQSREEPFAPPTTPSLVIIIDNMPVRSPLPLLPRTQLPPPPGAKLFSFLQ